MNLHGLQQGESIAFKAMDQSMVTCFLGSHQSHEEFVNLFAAEMKLNPSWNYLGKLRTCLAVQWLRLHASTLGGAGSISGQGTKIPQATQCGQKNKKKREREQGPPLSYSLIYI